jgi:EmrB/QacA subfamily drug resistance transporter
MPEVGQNWRPLALLVAGAFFMENLDGTIVVTATQRIAHSFDVPVVSLNLVITAYLLTLGVLIPISGWVADRLGGRTVFTAAIAVFTVASALCAVSTNLPELTAMRVLQGVGGAMMVPVGRLVVLRATAKSDLIITIAYLTWPALAAPMVAPAVGGALTTFLSWRWIFLVNLPLGVVALVIAVRIVPNVRASERRALDWWGFVLTGLGVAVLVGGLETVTDGTASWTVVALALAGGAVVLGLAVRHLRRARHPLLDLRIFRVPTFRVTTVGGSCFRMAIGAAPFLLPLLFQEAFGWNAFQAGLMVIPVFVGNIAIKPATTTILRRLGFRRTLVLSDCLAGVTLALCATFTAHAPMALIVLDLLASGVFRSVGFTAYNTIVFADVPQEAMSNANTLASTIQQVSMGLGVAIGALALHAGAPLARALGGGGSARGAFVVAFLLVALLPLVAVLESAALERQAGSALTAS